MNPKRAETALLLYEIYQDTLINYCKRNGHSEHDTQDYVSETFSRLLDNIDTVQALHPKEQRAWLYSTLKNIISENLNRRKFLDPDGYESKENILQGKDTSNRVIEVISYEEMIKTVYQNLSEEERAFLDEYIKIKNSYSQISRQEKINYNTFKSQIYRKSTPICKKIVQELRKQGIEIESFAPKNKKGTKFLK